MSYHRPIGLTCLVFVAGLLSIVLTIYSAGAFFQVVSLLKHDRFKPDHYPLGNILFAVANRAFQGLVFWIALLVLMLSFETIVYLRLPSIRSHFEAKPGA